MTDRLVMCQDSLGNSFTYIYDANKKKTSKIKPQIKKEYQALRKEQKRRAVYVRRYVSFI